MATDTDPTPWDPNTPHRIDARAASYAVLDGYQLRKAIDAAKAARDADGEADAPTEDQWRRGVAIYFSRLLSRVADDFGHYAFGVGLGDFDAALRDAIAHPEWGPKL